MVIVSAFNIGKMILKRLSRFEREVRGRVPVQYLSVVRCRAAPIRLHLSHLCLLHWPTAGFVDAHKCLLGGILSYRTLLYDQGFDSESDPAKLHDVT